MSNEELLQPRYKVIALWPNCGKTEIGDMINIQLGTTSGFHFKDATYFGPVVDMNRLNKYPHLFKKLEWWEERKVEDMPEYVKVTVDHMEHYGTPKDAIINVVWCYGVDKNLVPFWSTLNKVFWSGYSIPATKQEYNEYQSNQTQPT